MRSSNKLVKCLDCGYAYYLKTSKKSKIIIEVCPKCSEKTKHKLK